MSWFIARDEYVDCINENQNGLWQQVLQSYKEVSAGQLWKWLSEIHLLEWFKNLWIRICIWYRILFEQPLNDRDQIQSCLLSCNVYYKTTKITFNKMYGFHLKVIIGFIKRKFQKPPPREATEKWTHRHSMLHWLC